MSKKILQYVGGMDRAGAETLIMNIFRVINKEDYEFIFVYHGEKQCDYDKEILALGGKIYKIKKPNMWNINEFKSNFTKMIDEIGEVDVIHSHLNLMNGLVLKIASQNNIPIRISHSHSNQSIEEETLLRRIYTKLAKKWIRKYATEKIACSNLAGKYLYGDKDYRILQNGIEVKKFESNLYRYKMHKELNLNKNIKIITHIGRFVSVKNHEFIIYLFKKLLEEDESYRLILCGEGELKNKMEELVKLFKIENKVYFLGVREDVNEILLGTDIFVMPSFIEGIPLALIEAQVAGCKCIVSNNIPIEANLEIDEIEYLELDGDYKKWINTILKKKTKKGDFEERKKKIKESGYDIVQNIEVINQIYRKNDWREYGSNDN